MKVFSGKMISSRRGSLQLSINAIVVLVMAMVVLGLGLSFIRGLFDQGRTNLGTVMRNNELKNPATADDPITVDQELTLKRGKSIPVHVGFYNAETTSITASPAGKSQRIIVCTAEDGESQTFRVASPAVSVSPGSAMGFEVILSDSIASYADFPCEWISGHTGTGDECVLPSGELGPDAAHEYGIAPADPGLYVCPMKIIDSADDEEVIATQMYVQVTG